MKEQLATMIEEAEAIFASLKEDSSKFTEKGNNAAGTRVRTGAMSLTKKLKEIRAKVSEIKNSNS